MRPRRKGVHEVFCAILYLLKSGFQWNLLSQEFKAKSRVYDYFKLWKEKSCEDKPSLLEKALKKCGWDGPYQQ